jgi:hypothetical protein
LRKKIPRREAAGKIFFQQTPQGLGLGQQSRRSEICLRKSQWRKWKEIKGVKK